MNMEYQLIKKDVLKDLYSFRNGVLAETLKSQGSPFNRIFGLLLPQLTEIARKYPKNIKLANELWSESDCREFRLIAILLIPYEIVSKQEIFNFIRHMKTKEEIEIICFKVLKHLPYASDLYSPLSSSISEDMKKENNLKDLSLTELNSYMTEMLGKNLGYFC